MPNYRNNGGGNGGNNGGYRGGNNFRNGRNYNQRNQQNQGNRDGGDRDNASTSLPQDKPASSQTTSQPTAVAAGDSKYEI